VDEGQDIVVVMLSYGGAVGTESCKGLGKAEKLKLTNPQEREKVRGVIRLVYVSALMLSEGVSAFKAFSAAGIILESNV
jgi:hypothetical protein